MIYNNCTGLPDVERIRKMLYRRRRIQDWVLPALVWVVVIPGYVAGLILLCYHRNGVRAWLDVGNRAMVCGIVIAIAMAFFCFWMYRKGRQS